MDRSSFSPYADIFSRLRCCVPYLGWARTSASSQARGLYLSNNLWPVEAVRHPVFRYWTRRVGTICSWNSRKATKNHSYKISATKNHKLTRFTRPDRLLMVTKVIE